MAHNARIRKDEAWVIGAGVTSAEFVTLDTNLTKALNGDGGGIWQPTADLVVGGAGMWLVGPTPSIAGASSSITTSLSSGAGIIHADNDHILLPAGHAGRTRAIVTNFDRGQYISGWDDDMTYVGLKSIALGANAVVQLRVHNRSTFANIAFRFLVGSSHGPPANLPQFRVFQLDVNGVRTPLLTNGNNGYATFTPTPATAAAWFASGAVQAYVYSPSPTPVVDTSKYSYWAEVVEEQGANAAVGNTYLDATCAFTLITDLSPQ